MALVCKMNGMRDATVYRQERVPFASEFAFNGSILNMKAVVEVAKHSDINRKSHFFMSAYLMDILCAQHSFPKMKWSWNPIDAQCMYTMTNYEISNIEATMKEYAMTSSYHYIGH